ncbi:hypothetical protein CTEN210_06510 [Chaetoceros tenuissimus]|uniref:Carbohydrate sulfotransferase n=1 Tax=Chaetoceros tenuissimus TaxID=426638 RepID=A0AAD3CQM8_9STRA|nr:hypothetical protein CTEN210_06510 [Chaetoceros tenuissimus]
MHISSNDTSPFRQLEYPPKYPVVQQGDFSNEVFVNQEFKFIFFPIAKTACTEWVRFFMRLNNSPLWCSNGYEHGIHSIKHENIKFMSDYTLEEQTHMMTSKDWTRAIFVREPKKRVLSAFLDKSHNADWFRNFCPAYVSAGGDEKECIERRHDFDFFVKKMTVTLHDNAHWLPCYDYIDKKWWKYMTFISTMKNLSQDAEILLKSVKSSVDGVSAWDRIGKHGWGADFKKHGCEDSGDSRAFLEAKPTNHQTGASKTKAEKKFYTPELEKIVENRYAKDLHNPYFHFEEFKIFDNDDDSDVENIQ